DPVQPGRPPQTAEGNRDAAAGQGDGRGLLQGGGPVGGGAGVPARGIRLLTAGAGGPFLPRRASGTIHAPCRGTRAAAPGSRAHPGGPDSRKGTTTRPHSLTGGCPPRADEDAEPAEGRDSTKG